MSWLVSLRPWPCAVRRFWDIPELVILVSDSLPKADRSRLARTTRLCFYALIGSVWCEVRGACHLLALIPEVEVNRQSRRFIGASITLVRFLHISADAGSSYDSSRPCRVRSPPMSLDFNSTHI
jgi:hypothetical protein